MRGFSCCTGETESGSQQPMLSLLLQEPGWSLQGGGPSKERSSEQGAGPAYCARAVSLFRPWSEQRLLRTEHQVPGLPRPPLHGRAELTQGRVHAAFPKGCLSSIPLRFCCSQP